MRPINCSNSVTFVPPENHHQTHDASHARAPEPGVFLAPNGARQGSRAYVFRRLMSFTQGSLLAQKQISSETRKQNLFKNRKTSFFGVFGCEANELVTQAANKNDSEPLLAAGESIHGQMICPAGLDWPVRSQSKASSGSSFAQPDNHARICV